ncbi:MAG: type II secretion system F family protein [Acidimicrobiia bacterium]|nr:type II secretion system F family protein [Acidimicrobiia bacterium]
MIMWAIFSMIGLLGLAGLRRATLWRRRQREIRKLSDARTRGLPSAVLLVQVATSAGLSPRAALSTVGGLRIASGELGAVARDFAQIGERLDLGADLAEAILSVDATLTSSSFIRVLEVLSRAERDGVALATHLEIVLHDLRRERAVALDIAAQRLTVSLLFPLVVCILPAFVLMAVVPLLFGALSNLPG